MKPVLAALVAAVTLTAARAAHAEAPGERAVSSIVVSAALGEKERLAQVEATLRALRPGALLAPWEHAALWSFGMRWGAGGLMVLGADETVDGDTVLALLASTHAPSPAYRKILRASARVIVQARIVESMTDTATQLRSVVQSEVAAVEEQTRTVESLRPAAQALGEKLRAKAEALEVIASAVKDPATAPERRERLRGELADGVEEVKALSARLEAAKAAVVRATERLQEAAANLEVAMHNAPLGPRERELVARSDLELQRLRDTARRLDATPQLRPDQITVFPSVAQ